MTMATSKWSWARTCVVSFHFKTRLFNCFLASLKVVEINGTIVKHENKEKITKNLRGNPYAKKTTGRGENFIMNMKMITEYSEIENKP